MVPLRYRLRSGDTVEVLTSEKQNPGKDWLNFAVTARAKARIRQWLRSQQSERSIQLGNALLEHELEAVELTVSQLRRDGRLEQALKEFSQKDVDSLIAAIGYGIITPAQLLGKILTPTELKAYRGEKQPQPAIDKDRVSREALKSSGGVVVSGIGDVLVRFARCCNPLPGERITGFITRGRGVTVHLLGCPRALESDPQRRVPVVWQAGEESPRLIRLEVMGMDRPGMLASISKAIATAGVNISTAEVKNMGADGRSLMIFELVVTSAGQLNSLMHAVAAIEGVMKVLRLGSHSGANLAGR
jgi:GTP pyrophosphokinase